MRSAFEVERQQTNELLTDISKLLRENNAILKSIDDRLRKITLNTS